MSQGIKLSDQLYPATKEKIVTSAEYIYDNSWTLSDKDQKSINTYIRSQLSDKLTDNDLFTTLGITKLTNQQIGQEQYKTVLRLDNTIYNYNYPGSGKQGYHIEGILRGDVDNDGEVTIGDVTYLIDYLLTGSSSINEEAAPLIFKLEFNNAINDQYGGYKYFTVHCSDYELNGMNIQSSDDPIIAKLKILSKLSDNYTESQPNHQPLSQWNYKIEVELLKGFSTDFGSEITSNDGDDAVQGTKLYLGANLNNEDPYPLSVYNDPAEQPLGIMARLTIIDKDNAMNMWIDNDNTEVTISDVSNLIDFLLTDSWNTDKFSDIVAPNGLVLKKYSSGGSTPIECYPGIIYQGIDPNGIIHYFIAKPSSYTSNSNTEPQGYKLVPYKVPNYKLEGYILDWLKSCIIKLTDNDQDEESFDEHFISTIRALQKKYPVEYIYQFYEDNGYDIMMQDISEVLTPSSIDSIVEFPLFLYDSEYFGQMESEEDLQNYTPNIENKKFIISLSDNSNICLVDEFGREINKLYITRVDQEDKIPCILLRFKFKQGSYVLNNGYLELQNPIRLSVRQLGSERSSFVPPVKFLNCKIPV